MSVPVAKILEQRTHLVPGKLKITEHFFETLRDYSSPSSGTLRLFARSACKHSTPVDVEGETDAEQKKKQQLPWLLFLNGGPGFECRSPQSYGITQNFLDKGYQMLFLDQRGTGLSTPMSASTLGLRGDDSVQANYLKSFRADSIVKDCEAIRKALTADYPDGKKQWSILGQSFGGFCSVSYLSMFPEGIKEAFLFGGLPPLVNSPDEVYQRLFKKVVQRNKSYYEKYPEDVERVKTIVRLLKRFGDNTVRLPSEGSLTARRFLQMGLGFGAHGGLDNVHETVLRASSELIMAGHLTRQTTDIIDRSLPFDNNVLYALLHEPIYCQGHASNWSANRITQQLPEFDLDKTLEDPSTPVYFTGEMIFPFMLTSYTELRKLSEVANILAQYVDWPDLYIRDQLARNTVPVYAAVYMDDMYVDFDLSMETARQIRGCKTFVTNMMYHDAMRNKEKEVVAGLWQLRCDTLD